MNLEISSIAVDIPKSEEANNNTLKPFHYKFSLAFEQFCTKYDCKTLTRILEPKKCYNFYDAHSVHILKGTILFFNKGLIQFYLKSVSQCSHSYFRKFIVQRNL